MKTHKRRYGGGGALCGVLAPPQKCRRKWEGVTCKVCLGSKGTAFDPEFRKGLRQMPLDVRMDVALSVVPDDLPDGAYWAMMEEFGVEPSDFAPDD